MAGTTRIQAGDSIKRVLEIVIESAAAGPTLVIWFFDRSASAQDLTRDASRQLSSFYGEPLTAKQDGQAEPALLSLIVTFGSTVEVLLEKPTADAGELLAPLASLAVDPSGRENSFAAIARALDDFLPYRLKQGREVMFVVFTDETGDDWEKVEQLIDRPRKYGLPIYAVGPPAPLGRVAALDQSAEMPAQKNSSDLVYVRRGAESRHPEVIDLAAVEGDYALQTLDSGFGPFAWEWLCRSSGGAYLAARSAISVPLTGAAGIAPSRRGGDNYPYDPARMRTCAPDYVSEAEYQKILDSNAACMAVHRAAQFGRVEVLRNPQLTFQRQSEAQLKNLLDQAQTAAARLTPRLETLLGVLKRGQSDRARLTKPRWQAAYDLAMGRTLAALVRTEGYNQVLAALEGGKSFKNPGSTIWVLEAADEIDAGGKYRNYLKDAKMYLTRVRDSHPGTPWAVIAARELEQPIGWRWTER